MDTVGVQTQELKCKDDLNKDSRCYKTFSGAVIPSIHQKYTIYISFRKLTLYIGTKNYQQQLFSFLQLIVHPGIHMHSSVYNTSIPWVPEQSNMIWPIKMAKPITRSGDDLSGGDRTLRERVDIQLLQGGFGR